MDNCVFCKIIRKEIPSYTIYEDEKYLAILDISQLSKGHTLVIPKKHHKFVWDVEDSGYFEVAKKIANHFRSLGYKYVDCAVFGRMIEHSHIHLIPHNDEGEDWNIACEDIFKLQEDRSRWPSREVGESVANQFRLP